jgi:hypothetical protein
VSRRRKKYKAKDKREAMVVRLSKEGADRRKKSDLE